MVREDFEKKRNKKATSSKMRRPLKICMKISGSRNGLFLSFLIFLFNNRAATIEEC